MQITDILAQVGGVTSMAKELGVSEGQAASGAAALGQIFGSKDVSRAVGQSASAQSGIDPGLLKKMVPMLAMAGAGGLASMLDLDTDGNRPHHILRMAGKAES